MRTHIDWITFTMTPNYFGDGIADYEKALTRAFVDMFGESITAAAFGGNWSDNGHSRAPYCDAWKLGDAGVTLFASPVLTHCCVEISGQGCERLIEMALLGAVLEACSERVTRIDIASDIETDVSPSDFVKHTSHERMRASGHQLSETGETNYVGSQKSDRYARVYRYFGKHPRSHLLRIEHVFRRDYAKKVALACVESGINAVAVAAGNAFGWSHAVWKPEGDNHADISTPATTRKAGNTVHWLIKAAAPAFKKLVASGEIRDPEKFLLEYFIGYDGG